MTQQKFKAVRLASVLACGLCLGVSAFAQTPETPVADYYARQRLYDIVTMLTGQAGSLVYSQYTEAVKSNATLMQQLEHLQRAVVAAETAGKPLTDTEKADIANTLKRVTDQAGKATTLSYAAADIDKVFDEKFPGYSDDILKQLIELTPDKQAETFASRAKTIGSSLQTSVKEALQVAGVQKADFNSDATLLMRFRDLSDSTDSALTALQAGNRIGAMTASSLQRLHATMLSMQDMQANFIAYQKAKHDEAQMKEEVARAQRRNGDQDRVTRRKELDEQDPFGSFEGLCKKPPCN